MVPEGPMWLPPAPAGSRCCCSPSPPSALHATARGEHGIEPLNDEIVAEITPRTLDKRCACNKQKQKPQWTRPLMPAHAGPESTIPLSPDINKDRPAT